MFIKIKVIVVDDSAFMRKIISDIINSQSEMEVINTARNGKELLEKIPHSKPDVITLDIEMPKMNGMETLKQLKRININIPVIMLSSISKLGTESTMDCLELGAFDFIAKPSGEVSLDLNKVKDELVQKIKIAFMQNRSKISLINVKDLKANRDITYKITTRVENGKKNNIEAVVIGASTGGPKALYEVITALPSDIGVPVLVVQHMPVGFTKAFAERLNLNSKLKVIEASDGDLIEKNIVYIAPGV